MKGKFQTLMLFMIAASQSFFCTIYFEKTDATISTSGLFLFFISVAMYTTMLNENYKDKKGGIV